MPSFYEDLCRRLKERGLLQVWERSRAIALAAGTFAIPVNRATEACENWKLKFPDRTWNELRNLINQGSIVYQDGEFSELDYYYFGCIDNADKLRAIGLACQIFKITPIQAVHASEQFFVNKRRDWEALYHVISGGLVQFSNGEFQYVDHPLQSDLCYWHGVDLEIEPNDRFYCGLASIEDTEPIPELKTKTCEECAYFCRVGADINCNAFHQLLEANHCPDYQTKC